MMSEKEKETQPELTGDEKTVEKEPTDPKASKNTVVGEVKEVDSPLNGDAEAVEAPQDPQLVDEA
ncbi:hypothetical protein [Dolosigranulum pigrum]|jgi:hypothetical protein|nr:hypothetical protein [Dolosigranulum pigrum]QTJ36281.1 hypothetical protein FE323_04445 [Dolosigranulum pigrum]QTJ39718.1 hypothetical protein FE325_03965 [Dolosigranulum pigrum]QTJ48208.1 hypothetical protein FE330_03985 [Dolosigranulum pigrum]